VPFTPDRPVAEAKAGLFKALARPGRVRVPELIADPAQDPADDYGGSVTRHLDAAPVAAWATVVPDDAERKGEW
jgi:hypothetical protein